MNLWWNFSTETSEPHSGLPPVERLQDFVPPYARNLLAMYIQTGREPAEALTRTLQIAVGEDPDSPQPKATP